MSHKFYRWLILTNFQWNFMVIVGLLVFTGCNLMQEATPELLWNLDYSGDSVYPGDEATVWVTGPTSESTTYVWKVDGQVQNGQNEYIFTFIRDTPKVYRVEVEVRDEDNNQLLTGAITVEEPPPATTVVAEAIPTDTPSPTATYTPTPTTPLPTPTTPIPSPTPTTPAPTDTPTSASTPTYEAIVAAENGLNLRSGPGMNYNVIGFLRQGDTLDIEGRLSSNDWIQVIPLNPGTSGWVAAGPQYVTITRDLSSFPILTPPPPPPPPPVRTTITTSTTYSAPVLTGPDNGSGAFGTFPPLYWEWEGQLADDEYFEVRIWHESITTYHPALGWVKGPPFDFNISQERDGKYYWTVIIVKGAEAKLKDWIVQSSWPYPMWEGKLVGELSPESEHSFFFFTPSSSGSGSGGGGSPISKPPICPPPC